ncbi:MAG: hypothetical protein M3042_07395 [Actinomycetota bacterium]|nr:hypothetical protein [Actinomycetota bacterium]
MQDEGLVRPEEAADRRVFHLTDAGQAYVTAHAAELSALWEAVGGQPHQGIGELFGVFRQVAADRAGSRGARPTPGATSTASSPRTSRPPSPQ